MKLKTTCSSSLRRSRITLVKFSSNSFRWKSEFAISYENVRCADTRYLVNFLGLWRLHSSHLVKIQILISSLGGGFHADYIHEIHFLPWLPAILIVESKSPCSRLLFERLPIKGVKRWCEASTRANILDSLLFQWLQCLDLFSQLNSHATSRSCR